MSMYVRRIGSPIRPMTPSDVRYGSLADILTSPRHVRFTPKTDVGLHIQVCFGREAPPAQHGNHSGSTGEPVTEREVTVTDD